MGKELTIPFIYTIILSNVVYAYHIITNKEEKQLGRVEKNEV